MNGEYCRNGRGVTFKPYLIVKLNSVLVPVVEKRDTMLDIFDLSGLPKHEIVGLRFAVVTCRTKKSVPTNDGNGTNCERRP